MKSDTAYLLSNYYVPTPTQSEIKDSYNLMKLKFFVYNYPPLL